MSSSADDQYEQQNDITSGDVPTGNVQDPDYVSRTGQKEGSIPVQSDNDVVEDGLQGNQDSDEMLAKDDNEAIDKRNIIGEKTRGATKKSGTYKESGDEEGLENLS